MPRLSLADQGLSSRHPVKPASKDQRVSSGLSNRKSRARAQKETAATGVGARHGGDLDRYKQVGHYVKPVGGATWISLSDAVAEVLGLVIKKRAAR